MKVIGDGNANGRALNCRKYQESKSVKRRDQLRISAQHNLHNECIKTLLLHEIPQPLYLTGQGGGGRTTITMSESKSKFMYISPALSVSQMLC